MVVFAQSYFGSATDRESFILYGAITIFWLLFSDSIGLYRKRVSSYMDFIYYIFLAAIAAAIVSTGFVVSQIVPATRYPISYAFLAMSYTLTIPFFRRAFLVVKE